MAEDMNLQINIQGTNDTGGAFTGLDDSIRQVQQLVDEVSRSFQSFGEVINRTMGTTGAQAGREMEASMAGAQRGMQGATEAGNGFETTIVSMSKAISAEMIGEQLQHIGEVGMKAFEGAVEAAATFEYNISRIGAVLTTTGKASNDQMQQMSADALKIGSSSSFSANEIAEGMYTLARQGLDASTILGNGVNGAINIVNDLAQATDSSMTDTATVITDVVHEYGLSGAELRNVANIISGTLHNSSESLDDFYQSMKQVGPVASAMHQSVEDVSTSLAILAQHGITGSSAGTAMKNMLLGLEPHTKKAAALMHDLGISAKNGASGSFYQLNGNLKPLPDIIQILNDKFGGLNDKQKEAALATIFTKYGLAGLNTIVTESKDKFKEFQNELRKDDAATIAAKKMDNLHGDLLKFHAGVETMMKSFGDSIGGMLRPIVQGASQAIKWITQLPKPVKEVGMAFLGIGSVLAIAGGSVIAFAGGVKLLGPAIEMAGMSTAGLEAAAGALGAVFSEVLIPIALVVAAVAAVGIGFKLAYDHIKPFHDAVNNVIRTVKQVVEALKGLWQGGAAEGKGISILDNLGFSPAAVSAIQNVFARIKEGVAGAKQGFENVKNAVQGIFMILTGTGGGKGIELLQKLGFSKETIGNLMRMGGQFRAVFDGIKNAVTSSVNGIGNIVRPFITNLLIFWNTHQYQFRQTIQVVWNAIGNFLRTAVSFLVNTIGAAITDISNWWKDHWSEIKEVFQAVWIGIEIILAPIIANLIVIISAALGFIKGAWQNGWNAIKDELKFTWDLIKGIVKIAWDWIGGIIGIGLDLLTLHWSKAWDDIKSTFTKVWDDIKKTAESLGKDAEDWGKNIVEGIGKGIAGAVDGVVKAAKGVWDKIKGAFTGGGGASANINITPAAHATGGIFSSPHLGLVAEAGPEAIIPLSNPSRGLALWQQAGEMLGVGGMALPSSSSGGVVYNITVHANGNITRNEQALGDIVSRAILSKVKMQGRI